MLKNVIQCQVFLYILKLFKIQHLKFSGSTFFMCWVNIVLAQSSCINQFESVFDLWIGTSFLKKIYYISQYAELNILNNVWVVFLFSRWMLVHFYRCYEFMISLLNGNIFKMLGRCIYQLHGPLPSTRTRASVEPILSLAAGSAQLGLLPNSSSAPTGRDRLARGRFESRVRHATKTR
jgi:hypothetical protein